MLWDLLRVAVIFISHIMILPMLGEQKPSIKHPVILYLAVFIFLEILSCIVFFIIGDFDARAGFLLLAVSTLLYGASFIAVSDGSVLKSIFLFTIYCTYYMFAAYIALSVSILAIVPEEHSEAVMMAILGFFAVVFAFALKLGGRDWIRRGLSGISDEWGALALFAGMSFIAVSGVVMLSLFSVVSDVFLNYALPVMMLLLVTSAFAVVLQMMKLLSQRNEMAFLRAEQVLLQNELEAEREFVDNARKYRHDLKHHSRQILQYIKDGNIEEAKSYLREYDDELSGSSMPQWCSNKIANDFIRITVRKCASLMIPVSIKADIPEKIPVSGPDFGLILGNILEYAVRKCSEIPASLLSVTAKEAEGVLLFEVRNQRAGVGSAVESADALPSAIKSASDILGNYDGMLQFNASDVSFSLRFILPLRASSH